MKATRKLCSLASVIPAAVVAVLSTAPLAHADAGPYCPARFGTLLPRNAVKEPVRPLL